MFKTHEDRLAAGLEHLEATAALPANRTGSDLLAPGDNTVRSAYVGSYGDGAGGSINVDAWLDMATANWDADASADNSQLGQITLWVVQGSKHDATKPGDVTLVDYQVFNMWPGDCGHYQIGSVAKGSVTLQIVNTGKIPVTLDLHRQPA